MGREILGFRIRRSTVAFLAVSREAVSSYACLPLPYRGRRDRHKSDRGDEGTSHCRLPAQIVSLTSGIRKTLSGRSSSDSQDTGSPTKSVIFRGRLSVMNKSNMIQNLI